MSIAIGAQAAIGLVAEGTWGSTPTAASVALDNLPFTSFSISKGIEKLTNSNILGDRQLRVAAQGNTTVTGDIDVAYSPLQYDSLLESLCTGAWSANVLTLGTTVKSFLIEHAQTDIAVPAYFQYNGVRVDKMNLKLATTGITTAKFSLIGKDSFELATVDSNGAYTAVTEVLPFSHAGGTFLEGAGLGAIGYFASLDLNIENKLASNFALGTSTVRDLTSSFFEVSGTAQVYFEDMVMYNKFIANTKSKIQFTLTAKSSDGSTTYTHTYLLSDVRYSGATKAISGNGPIMLQMPFTSYYDATNTNLKITRTAV